MIKRYLISFLLGLIFTPAFTQNQKSVSATDSSSYSAKPPSNFHQRWQYDDGSSYFIPIGNKQWAEFNWKGEVKFRYVLIEEKPSYTVLYDSSRGSYAKLTNSQLFYGNNLDGLVYGAKHGTWIEEPAKKKK